MTAGLLQDEDAQAEAEPAPPADRAFFRWAVGIYVSVTAVLLVLSLRRTDGHVVYLTDDPAIHLAVANNLAFHGTWGVVPGHFESASSSPLWTVGLAGLLRVTPIPREVIPLLLNAAASVVLLWILGAHQRVLKPSRSRPLDVVAVAILVVVVLFLPALTLLGMEHVLHMALVLGIVVVVHRHALGERTPVPVWAVGALVAVATLARFETMFVVAGMGVALLALSLPGWRPDVPIPTLGRRFRLAVVLGLASFAAFALFALFNRAMGQGWLPNSVLAKSMATNGNSKLDLKFIGNRFTSDPMLAALVGACVAGLIIAWRQGVTRFVFPAITVLVATGIHVVFADVGWYERYEAYLIVVAVYALFVLAEEALPAVSLPPARSFVVPCLVIALLIFSATKASLTESVPKAVADTYEQRYQAARFLAQYYDNQPVATSELGYIGLDHHGPVTDILGLGDYEVLQARRNDEQHPPKSYWSALARERGFKVVATYPTTILYDTPDDWILVGTWTLPRRPITAFESTFQFWATTPDEVRPLEARLREFAQTAPAGTQLEINNLAEYRADNMLQGG